MTRNGDEEGDADRSDRAAGGGGRTSLSVQDDITDSIDSVEYIADGRYRAEYDPALDRPSLAVVAVVATVAGADPLELAPLQSAVDTESLDRLLRGPSDGPAQNDLELSFRFFGFEVTVDERAVELRDPSESDAAESS